jgi:hypothetical protein
MIHDGMGNLIDYESNFQSKTDRYIIKILIEIYLREINIIKILVEIDLREDKLKEMDIVWMTWKLSEALNYYKLSDY